MLYIYDITFADGYRESVTEIGALEARQTATWCGSRTEHGAVVAVLKVGEVDDDDDDTD